MSEIIEDLKDPRNLAQYDIYLQNKGIPIIRIKLETFETNNLEKGLKEQGYNLISSAALSLDRIIILAVKNNEHYIGTAIRKIPKNEYTITIKYKVKIKMK